MKVLVVTNAFPTEQHRSFGIFVKEQIEKIQALRPNWQLDVLFINGRESRWNYLKGIWHLRQRLHSRNYDLIHAHYGFSGVIARFQHRCSVIVTFHGSDVNIRWQGIISKILTRLVDCVIVATPHMKVRLKHADAIVIPSGVDLNLFKPVDPVEARQELGLPTDKKLVLFPGSPDNKVKNYELFLKALAALPYELRTQIEITRLANVERCDVPKYLSACDLIVMTSLHEGSPMLIKEGLACNTPIVSVPVGDVPRLIDGVKNCCICNDDPQALANLIKSLLHKSERSNGRNRLMYLGLSSEAIAERVVELYEKYAV